MAVTHTCDACKKPINGERTTVDPASTYNCFEFSVKCAAPILSVLKKYKLATTV